MRAKYIVALLGADGRGMKELQLKTTCCPLIANYADRYPLLDETDLSGAT
jgi:hypothetical protein